MIKKQECPQIEVGTDKNFLEIKNVIRLAKRLDKGDIRDKLIAENYNKELQELSNGSIGLRIWTDWDNSLRCIVIYPNSAIKEFMEY